MVSISPLEQVSLLLGPGDNHLWCGGIQRRHFAVLDPVIRHVISRTLTWNQPLMRRRRQQCFIDHIHADGHQQQRHDHGERNGVGSGATSPASSLNMDPNTISVMETAQDGGTTHLYTIRLLGPLPRLMRAIYRPPLLPTVRAIRSPSPCQAAYRNPSPLHPTRCMALPLPNGASITYTPVVGYSCTDNFT